MQYTQEQFIEDVKAEAKALREHATKEELNRLDINLLDPSTWERCIYGLATGNCFSHRATELIVKCCKRYFKGGVGITGIMREGIRGIFERVNGTEAPEYFRAKDYYSSIEAYILLPEARNAALIAYLRGETDELILV